MEINSKITLAVTKFFRKYKVVIIIVIVVWLIIIAINNYLRKNKKNNTQLSNSYNPDKAVIDYNGSVPTRYRNNVKDEIEKFFNYCNDKDYESAYNELTDDAKSFLYDNSMDEFKTYIVQVFGNSSKKYYLQNYSNYDNYYIYDIYIMDDIESTGGEGGYSEHKEKVVVVKNNNEYKISNQGYIGKKEYNVSSESDEMKVKVVSEDISYSKASYNVEITNKTDEYILVADSSYIDEVTLNLGDQKRNATNTQNATVLVPPNSTISTSFIFDKFADDEKDPTEINFNDVRIYNEYNTSLTPENAENLFSFNISLSK